MNRINNADFDPYKEIIDGRTDAFVAVGDKAFTRDENTNRSEAPLVRKRAPKHLAGTAITQASRSREVL